VSYQVIARKWRPQTFEEVTGQEHITRTLRNAIEHGRLHHAYLFSGARGVGKTTTARLLAKSLNCHKTDGPNVHPCSVNDPDPCTSCREISESRSLDVLEFDAASNTQVDKIREIILENINIAPARDRYKIFIIDEVHMLSNSSFNALLKTLEEPPPNVVFVMATTELHKVPDTIASRCQEFEFRTIAVQKIFERLKLIAEAERIDVSDGALKEIARSGEGSMRDAQSNFDQVISFSGEKIAVSDVEAALGLAGAETSMKVLTAIAERRPKDALDVVADLVSRGQDLRVFCRDMLGVFRDILVFKVGGEELAESAALGPEAVKEYAGKFSESDLIRFFNSLAETESKLREAMQSRYVLEIGLVKLIELRRLAPIESVIEKLAALESGRPFAGPLSAAASVGQEKKTLNPDAKSAAFTVANEPSEPDFDQQFSPNASPRPEPKFEAIDLNLIGSLPVKLPPIASEELEHVDDAALDSLFEERLARLGEALEPIPNASDLAADLVGDVSINGSINGQAGEPESEKSMDLSRFFPPDITAETESPEIPTLPPDPTHEDLTAYVNAHPTAKRVMKIFRAEIVNVSHNPPKK